MNSLGVDIGSTTIKTIVLTPQGTILYKNYTRHHGLALKTFVEHIKNLNKHKIQTQLSLAITGSGGMGLAENLGIPFVQEVVGAAKAVRTFYPDTQALIDMGGEDSKLMFFKEGSQTDIRMNGNCAGGTGAFLDQMASLMGVPLNRLNTLAESGINRYPIASRCGVFAKTDIQNMLSRGISKADIAHSLFHSIALQVANTLMRGFSVSGNILFSGGPFAYFPKLRKAFMSHLSLAQSKATLPEYPQFLSALGAALHGTSTEWITEPKALLNLISTPKGSTLTSKGSPPLFDTPSHYRSWKKTRFAPAKKNLDYNTHGKGWFLGIDSGSTTTKMVLVDEKGQLGPHDYRYNDGDSLKAVKDGLLSLEQQLSQKNEPFIIRASAVTGYGEDLVKTFAGIDMGVVETLSHVRGAREFHPNISFLLDLGGQDMKAVYLENNHIQTIEINEACSSGCGSFIHTFSQALGYRVEMFAEMACTSPSPTRLGSRCTVFMNSRVKQSLKDGASLSDISAGLAYAVIDNALQKVLKIRQVESLGDTVLVQGGTFLNPSIHRAFEKRLKKTVICPDIPGLMGAYGAALLAQDHTRINRLPSRHFSLKDMGVTFNDLQRKTLHCSGCENTCTVTQLSRNDASPTKRNSFYSGNKCDRIFSAVGDQAHKGFNHIAFRNETVFSHSIKNKDTSIGRIGIPRALNMFENLPFFRTLLSESGFDIIVSKPSNMALYEQGAGSIMSDNICFPAKLMHGHILDLIKQNVDRIFYPMVVYEILEGFEKNSYNCPIISGYPDVIDSAMNPSSGYGIQLDKPPMTFKDPNLLKHNCWSYLKSLGVDKTRFDAAFTKALFEQERVKKTIRDKAFDILQANEVQGKKTILLLGRPYHYDSLINHKLPEMICGYDMDVISSCVMFPEDQTKTLLDHAHVFTQWAYTNRLYEAVHLAERFTCLEVVCINSFGCGPDAIAVDELKGMLQAVGKNITVIRVDEMVSPNSIRLRIRTLVEMMRQQTTNDTIPRHKRKTTAPYRPEDKQKQLILPMISEFHAPYVEDVVSGFGYKTVILPNPDTVSRDLGLTYTNNEMCYPAILIIGDVVKALTSGTCDPTNTVVGLFLTGGQCRLSSYLSLIKKALVSAGFDHVPVIPIVVSVNGAHQKVLKHPVFKLNTMKLIENGFYYLLYCDVLSRMYYTTVTREKTKGQSHALIMKYITRSVEEKIKVNKKSIIQLLTQAIDDFNAIDVHDDAPCNVIGLVGEIYVKYNTFANHNVVNWLISQNMEIDVPPLMYTVFQMLANKRINRSLHLTPADSFWLLSPLFEFRAEQLVRQVDRLYQTYRFYKPFHTIKDLKNTASEVMSLSSQFGEGWMIAAEILQYAKEGVSSILCLQPFGCIANQVIAKGLEKKIKDMYPDLSILYIDLDFDTSEVNMFNRLHFLIQHARDLNNRDRNHLPNRQHPPSKEMK